ncbi:MAG: hypothetical protein LUQ01_06430, partial [Methanolinea sp.]|nr:hypothetical protein [Methanolinea sp.]
MNTRVLWCTLFCSVAAVCAQAGVGEQLAAGDVLIRPAVIGIPALAVGRDGRSGEDCPASTLCGQDFGGCGSMQWFFYSDLNFCYPEPTTCVRVRCENFPPPGVADLTTPINVITWYGVFVDDGSNGCPPHEYYQFRIRFYEDENGTPKTPETPYYSTLVYASAEPWGLTYSFCFGCFPAQILIFTAQLDTPVSLGRGWLSIVGADPPSGCYHLWGGSGEGDNKIYAWYEIGGTIPGDPVTTTCDINYCLGVQVYGACCDDCSGVCLDNTDEVYCTGIGGRFSAWGTCADLTPPCGQALGACCHEDGTCAISTCSECAPPPGPYCCTGDINCDGVINFDDINAFVYLLSVPYPEFWYCTPCNGDINCDGVYGYGSFGDINPFVALMVACASGCP